MNAHSPPQDHLHGGPPSDRASLRPSESPWPWAYSLAAAKCPLQHSPHGLRRARFDSLLRQRGDPDSTLLTILWCSLVFPQPNIRYEWRKGRSVETAGFDFHSPIDRAAFRAAVIDDEAASGAIPRLYLCGIDAVGQKKLARVDSAIKRDA